MKQQGDALNESVCICVDMCVCVLICWCTERHFFSLHVGTSTVKSIKGKRVLKQAKTPTETDSKCERVKNYCYTVRATRKSILLSPL